MNTSEINILIDVLQGRLRQKRTRGYTIVKFEVIMT